MLSLSPGVSGTPYFDFERPVGPSLISTLPHLSNALLGAEPSQEIANPGISSTRGPGVVVVHVRVPVVTDSPMLLVIGPREPGESDVTGSPGSGDPLDSADEGNNAASAEGGPVSPLQAFADANLPGDGEDAPVVTSTAGSNTEIATPAGGIGWVTFGPQAAGGSSTYFGASDGPNGPVLADMKRLEIAGSLSSDQPTMTFQIPVGPMTEALGLSLDQTGGNGGMVPEFGQMELLNPNGTPIEQAPPPGGSANMLQALSVLLRGASANSRLQVQVVAVDPSSGASSSSSNAESGTTAMPGPNSSFNVSFVMEVQRQDFTMSTPDANGSVPGAVPVGTLIVASSFPTGSMVSSSDWTTSADGETASGAAEPTSTTTTVSVATTEIESGDATDGESFDSFNVRVSTGPLASRTASPLGPTLASIDGEATEPVDRHERAMSQEIAGVESLDRESSLAWRADDGTGDPSANWPGAAGFAASEDGPVIDAPGNGGFPMKVTSQGRGHPSELSALWATLPSLAESGSAASGPEHSESLMGDPPLDAVAVERADSDLARAPNYVKAACAMAFGLVMTTGPLFPDLFAGLRRRASRRR